MKQEMTGWQWHQLDHTQIICTLLQTDNHASTSSLIFTSQMLFLTPTLSVAGPTAWNSLPDYLRDPTRSVDSFRRDLKTFLFSFY